MPNNRTREVWIDEVKAIACLLVVLGHLFQGLVKAGIIENSSVHGWFEMTVYTFHVPLFFVCSGYLHQKYTKIETFNDWWRNIRKKALVLGVPYVAFTCVTLALKVVVGDAVNTREAGLLQTLLFHPTAPYWYLYTLFFIFVVTPTTSGTVPMLILFAISVAAKAVNLFEDGLQSVPYAFDSVARYWCWFTSGMCISSMPLQDCLTKRTGLACLCFLPLSVIVYKTDTDEVAQLLLGITACICVLSLCRTAEPTCRTPLFDFLARFTMPIYLMHTIFSAGTRAVLVRLGITSTIAHVSMGIAAGFVGPVLAMLTMERLSPLDFLVYPTRYIKIGATR